MKPGKRRVVVTGLGMISPVGNTAKESWEHLVAGQSGIATVSRFDVSPFSVHFAGEVKNFQVEDYISSKEARHMDVFIHYGIAAGIQAIKDSGLNLDQENREMIGVVVGSGIGGLPMIEENYISYASKGPRRISPFLIPGSIINMISGHLSIMFGLKGPNLAIATACTTGTHSIGEAARIIEYGDADVMVAGGAESTISPLGLGGFASMRALSTRNEDPSKASRPWDKDRDGFVLGEGAGVLVLEEYGHAKKRGAKIYCELLGYGMSADANHMTSPSPDGNGAMRAMQNALRNAGLNPDQVQYINAHGTSTLPGDLAETMAIKSLFNEYSKKLVISSTKSMTGHLLGAAGGIEAVITALAIHHQIAPPTINLDNPSDECDLDYCAHHARDLPMQVAISNSFAFGGTNGSLVFGKT